MELVDDVPFTSTVLCFHVYVRGYALRPHGCVLGDRQMRPQDRRGALVVARDRLEEELIGLYDDEW